MMRVIVFSSVLMLSACQHTGQQTINTQLSIEASYNVTCPSTVNQNYSVKLTCQF
ncbi:hypothetical protein I2F27_11335 [Acinetobacter sp. B5B]|uniref:hypothetical protein n=1 Tax=Acinetobacter baretiae TaxID=2605383 RepID=UPI0018C22537|nr:hypothetical protein [Acinetobacter baretiae]MBF7683912.1 hypothetical protein [Acinetobacter baretiae]